MNAKLRRDYLKLKTLVLLQLKSEKDIFISTCDEIHRGCWYFIVSLSSNRDVNIKYRLPRQVTVIDKKTGLNITTFTPLQQEVTPPCCYITFNLH